MSYFDLPTGFYRLCFASLLERFSFFGVVSILSYFLMQELSFSQENGIELTNQFKYYAPWFLVCGGITIDLFLVGKPTMALAGFFYLIGALLMCSAGLAARASVVYVALGLLIVGQALFRPALYSQLVSFFDSENDPRLPLSFMILYWFTNIGAFLAPLACGLVATKIGWSAGFLVAAMSAGGIVLIGSFFLNHQANKNSSQFKNRTLILTLIALALVAFAADYAQNIVGKIETMDTSGSMGKMLELMPSIATLIIMPFLWITIRKKFPDLSIKSFVVLFISLAIISSVVLLGLSQENGITKFAFLIVSTTFFSLVELLAFTSILKNTPDARRGTVAGGYLTIGHLLA